MDFATLIKKLFEARQAAHQTHLKTRSFAAHKALNEFYDGILEIADELAEVVQGEFGLLDLSVGAVATPEDFALYLKEMATVLKASSQLIPGIQSYHLNIIDVNTKSVLNDYTIVISKDKILNILPSKNYIANDSIQLIDLKNIFLKKINNLDKHFQEYGGINFDDEIKNSKSN